MKKLKNSIFPLLAMLLFLQPAARAAQAGAAPAAPAALPAYYRPILPDPAAFNPAYGISLFQPQHGEDGARTWSQTQSMLLYALGAMGVLFLLPEESTGWDKDGGNTLKKWRDNVTTGPTWDRDKWGYNYAGHAWAGGVYYQVARKSGYRQWDSFIYSALMSSFLWEYGIEAFAEVPSVQDLVYTPIAGWLYGEWAYQTEFKIRRSGGRVLGSGFLGGVSLFLLDPVDAVSRGINRTAGRELIQAGYGYFSYMPIKTGGRTDHQVYLHFFIPIGPAGPSAEEEMPHGFKHTDDPVDTGIIGFGTSVGHTAMDRRWNVTDGRYTKLHLGLYFTPRLSMRLAYAFGDLRDKTTHQTVEYENYSWDTQFYLRKEQRLRPYLTGGFGRQVRHRDNTTQTFQLNAGLGAHWQFHRKLALNADWILFYAPSKNTRDQQFNAGLIYRFGGGEHPDW